MNAIEIVKKYLKTNGAMGLIDKRNKCHCTFKDLGRCGYMDRRCQPGYKHPDGTMRAEKPEKALADKEPIKEKE